MKIILTTRRPNIWQQEVFNISSCWIREMKELRDLARQWCMF
jgi:hypothetical protein